MCNYFISENDIEEFLRYLVMEERAEMTIEKYVRDVRRFTEWCNGRKIEKKLVMEWKENLIEHGYCPTTINSMLASVHGYFRFAGIGGCNVKFLKIQRRIFRDQNRELNKDEYRKLIMTARSEGKERLAMLIETIGATGVRVSEVKYITVEAVRMGRAEIALKGKIRTILIPGKLARKLGTYAKKEKITSGEIFVTRNGTGMSRKQIWAEMKEICGYAGVESTKVFPHNLRHLFAITFYKASRDIVRLADVLGHSSIETTRIYLVTTGNEYMSWLDGLRMVC